MGDSVAEIYSHSRLEAFDRCPRQFFYRYRLQLPAESESVEAYLGKRVHDVLERLYRATAGGRVPSLPRVQARFRQLFDDGYDPARVRIVRLEHPLGFYRELGEHCLANYYADHYPFDRDETLGVEERVLFDLGDTAAGPVRVQGFIDRIARARDGAVEIHDYKTGARVASQNAVDQDRQLALYQLGLERRFGPTRAFRLVWHFVRSGVTRSSTRTAEQLEALREDTLARVRRIQSESDFPAKPSQLCRWCEYRDGCSANPLRDAEAPSYERRQELQRQEPAAAARVAAPTRRGRRSPPVDPGQLSLPFTAPAAAV